MANQVNYPTPGCIVEFLEDNAPQIAMVLEESGGKLRLLLPNRRETKLSAARILPWLGPVYSPDLTREDSCRALDSHKKQREEKAAQINTQEVWELSQGEIAQAPASWFAELFENDPSADDIAAFGHALLDCKTHFRFQPPEFLVYDTETVEKRLSEKDAREQKEALIAGGANFLRILWEIAAKKRAAPADFSDCLPSAEVAKRIENLLKQRLINPDTTEDDHLWQLISKGLPELPHLPLQLLTAWQKLPLHYNFWLDRAGFEADDKWQESIADVLPELERTGECKTAESENLPELDLPFISIDGETTTDIDDAFYMEKTDSGWKLVIALACPALNWPFGEELDHKIAHRATSLYLPEAILHMLPQSLGENAFSLLANKTRPALCYEVCLDSTGNPGPARLFLAKVRLAANLRYPEVQAFLESEKIEEDNPAKSFSDQLLEADKWARSRENWRINQGAVIMHRPDQIITLDEANGEIIVNMEVEPNKTDASRIVTEMMVLASSGMADWAFENNLPMIHRTQNITIAKDYAGIWSEPADLAMVIRSLMPSILEIAPKRHAALAAERYIPVTSPLRRYSDLVNEGQIIHFLQTGKPRWDGTALEFLLNSFNPSLELVGQVQKYRPRYWKLLYFRQQGDKRWWDGVITEENENFVMVNLPDQGIFAKGKREMFDERACPGTKVQIRLGKVNPLYNEIHIIEAVTSE